MNALTSVIASIRRAIFYPALGDLGPEYSETIRLHLPPVVNLGTRLDDARELVVTRLKLEQSRGQRGHCCYDANRQIALRQMLDAIDLFPR